MKLRSVTLPLIALVAGALVFAAVFKKRPVPQVTETTTKTVAEEQLEAKPMIKIGPGLRPLGPTDEEIRLMRTLDALDCRRTRECMIYVMLDEKENPYLRLVTKPGHLIPKDRAYHIHDGKVMVAVLEHECTEDAKCVAYTYVGCYGLADVVISKGGWNSSVAQMNVDASKLKQ